MDAQEQALRMEQVRTAASRLMHLHYCENDVDGVISYFAPRLFWIGAGEAEYASSREKAVAYFLQYREGLPKCTIRDEEYDVMALAPDTYLCTGKMWIATDPASQMYLKVHQRVSFVFQWIDGRPLCAHIHCSNPYLEMLEGENFPRAIGRQSYEYVQERLRELEAQTQQREHQLGVIMSSIPGGLKTSRDDATYSYAYVSPEAAALFGYTVEEFLEMSDGGAVGAVYPPDLPKALADCEECFRDGGEPYSTKYRIRCKDGCLKWVLDSGRKTRNGSGETMIHSLYLDITKEEQTTQEILRQQQLLQSIYDTVPCGILRFARADGQYTLLSLNRAAQELLSYRDEGACIADWKNGVAGSVLDEDRPALKRANEALLHAGDQVDISYRARRLDGGIRWLSGTNTLISSSQGRDVIQRTMFDVTDRKLLQERLEREQEMYRVAMESSSDVMYEYLPDEDVLVTYEPRSNGAAGENVTRLELPHYRQNLELSGLVHPDDVQAVIDNICRGQTEIFEARLLPPGGQSYVWYRVTGKVINGADRPRRVVGTLRNIHQEKQALSANEAELHMHQSALQALSSLYSSIYYVDLPSDRYYGVRIPDFSKTTIPRSGGFYEELSKYFRAQVHEEDLSRMLPFADPGYLMERLRTIGQRLEVEFRQRDGGPEQTWLRLDFQLISTEKGAPKNAIATFRNITQARRQELVRRREEEQAKRALEDAYTAANRANQAKSDFLSKMSHDMRTPMNAIMGMTAIAQQNLSDPKRTRDCLQKIQLSSRHLLELINEVLDMSKIESGSIGLNESVFDLYQLLQQTVDMIRPDVDRRGHRLRVQIGHMEHGTVLGDSVRIQQILINLLSNAVKYTPDGGHITLDVQETVYSSSSMGCYTFLVEDDGIGMSPEFQRKLFRPFMRAEDSRVSQIQGTGLGMAITQNLVQMMDGSIQVDSHLDAGTRFTVTLHLKTASRPERIPPPAPNPEQGGPRFQRSARILLVEDNLLNREIARELLEASGLTVEEAADGAQALELFRRAAPGYYRLILMDIQMPVMDGYQATRAIRGLDRPDAASIPIIALTANAFAEDVSRARQAGMNEHLSKPLEIDQLAQALRRWLG